MRVGGAPRCRVERSREHRGLVCIECSVLGSRYLVFDPDGDGWRRIRSLRDACGAIGGDLTLLWHDSELRRPRDRRLYAALLAEGTGASLAGAAVDRTGSAR